MLLRSQVSSLSLADAVGGSRIDNVPVRAFTRTFVLTAVGSG